MRDIKPISSNSVLHEDDVRRAVNGLDKGVRYLGSDLYARYSDAAHEAGRKPAHPVAVGQVLARWGLKRVKVTVGGSGRGNPGRGKQVVAWEIPWNFQ